MEGEHRRVAPPGRCPYRAPDAWQPVLQILADRLLAWLRVLTPVELPKGLGQCSLCLLPRAEPACPLLPPAAHLGGSHIHHECPLGPPLANVAPHVRSSSPSPSIDTRRAVGTYRPS